MNWIWASRAGVNGGTSDVTDIVSDSLGFLYIAGYFRVRTNLGGNMLTANGVDDILVAKLSPDGAWIWAQQAGGLMMDRSGGLAIDASGSLYVSGQIMQSGSFGTINVTTAGENDVFVAKFDSQGNWIWVQMAGGSSYDIGQSIYSTGSGIIKATGYFYGNCHFGETTLTCSGTTSVYCAQLGPYTPITDENHEISYDNLATIYPNPFSREIRIDFYLRESSKCRLSVYNLKGQKIRTLLSKWKDSGIQTADWNGTDAKGRIVSPGIYFLRFETKGVNQIKRIYKSE